MRMTKKSIGNWFLHERWDFNYLLISEFSSYIAFFLLLFVSLFPFWPFPISFAAVSYRSPESQCRCPLEDCAWYQWESQDFWRFSTFHYSIRDSSRFKHADVTSFFRISAMQTLSKQVLHSNIENWLSLYLLSTVCIYSLLFHYFIIMTRRGLPSFIEKKNQIRV